MEGRKSEEWEQDLKTQLPLSLSRVHSMDPRNGTSEAMNVISAVASSRGGVFSFAVMPWENRKEEKKKTK